MIACSGSGRTLSALASVVLALTVSGCGGDGRLPTAPVSGTVTFESAPVPTGSLLFVPEGGGPSAQGNLDADGHYTLGTYTTNDGAILGRFKVMITAFTQPTGGAGLPEDTIKGDAAPISLISEVYGDLENSGLTATVVKGKNTIDFDLEKKEDPRRAKK
ncbi:hypothetical protein [Planctellipticum variicoloris]|uniref:hypothetical protein n=1 Tax=Planctellipticum variicoloris TaxID=3064265 RepID=UPI003013795B|nr:hypothetical protein SH412_005266 [Planctomycetaceae bacterium SH412]